MATLTTSYYVASSAADTTTLTTAAFTPAVGEILIIKIACSDADQLVGTPTASGFTTSAITSRVNVGTATSTCRTALFTCSVTSSASGTIAETFTQATKYHSMVVERWTSAQLAASPAVASVVGDVATPWTLGITTAANNSVVSYVCADWQAVTGTEAFTGDTATPTQEQTKTAVTNEYNVWWLYQAAATAGSQTIGLSAPSGMNLTIAAIEVQDSGGGSTNADITFPARTDVLIR